MSDKRSKRSKKTRSHAQGGDSPLIYKIFLSSLRASLTAFAISMILALIMSAVAVKSSDPTALLTPLSFAALYLSSLACGFFSIRDKIDSALTGGAFSGVLFMLFYKFTALFLPSELGSERNFFVSVLLHILIILFSCLGAFAAVKIKKSKKRKRR